MGWLSKAPEEGEVSLQMETTGPQPWLKADGSCKTRRSGDVGLGVGVVCQQLWREVGGWEELVELVAGVPSGGRWVRCPCHLVLFSCQVEVLPWKKKLSEA